MVEMMVRYSNQPSAKPPMDDLALGPGSDGEAIPKRTRQYLGRRQLEGLKADYEAGMTIKAICSKYSVTRNTVRIRARSMGLPPRGPRSANGKTD
jgi:hypothetical protein